LTTGVVIFEHANYLGQSAHVTMDIDDLKDTTDGPCVRSDGIGADTRTYLDWENCISSIRLAPGWRVTVYRDDDFKGQSLEVTADVANLQLSQGSCDHGGFNDCISSIRLQRP